jgi:DNA gyrase subunit A
MARTRSRPPTKRPAVQESIQAVALDDTTRQRYLNYALSVITARALPDVRDGLKPVQRRILFSMFHNHRLTNDRHPIKSAKVVGSVIGEWHPHGDSAVYEAMARMAQPWTLRVPLVDGHGNFGSIDGDPPAAYRYTEARLTTASSELLSELQKDTVDFQANYDGRAEEPLILPARFPNLLVNGSTGIAVGMATNIPPHNLGEVIEAAITLIDHRDCSITDLLKSIKGPDFPTGGEILNSRAEIREIYETGQGSIRVRGEFHVDEQSGDKTEIVITSIPFAVDKSTILERIGELIATRKVPQLVDVRDESTTSIRMVLEVPKGADPQVGMAYLFKHTPLQNNFSVNLTCLVPVPNSHLTRPECVHLKRILELFIDFRFETVKRRFSYDLRMLQQRIHILQGFKTIFDVLDQALAIIRQSDGKADAAEKLQRRYRLDDKQTNVILDTPIYKLSHKEIKKFVEELVEKQKEAKKLETLLASKAKLWSVVKQELQDVSNAYSDKRRTKVGRRQTEEIAFDPEAYMVKEDAMITVSTDGWIRRVGIIKDLGKARLREGDTLLTVLGGSTTDMVVFFSNFGSAYTIRIGDIPQARSGYGDPAQKLFKFKDKERVIAACSLDPRMLPALPAPKKKSREPTLPLFDLEDNGEIPNLGQSLAVTSAGMGVRFELGAFLEPTTRLGRKYIKIKPEEEVVGVHLLHDPAHETVAVASLRGRVLLCAPEEVSLLARPGRGVMVIKIDQKDGVVAFQLLRSKGDQMTVLKEDGAKLSISSRKYQSVSRGGKGHALFKRGALKGWMPQEQQLPEFPSTNGA